MWEEAPGFDEAQGLITSFSSTRVLSTRVLST